jgi:hypothetical protein
MGYQSTNVICMTESCLKKTCHRTGYCEVCRTHECAYCKIRFISQHKLFFQKKICGECQQKRTRKADGVYLEA